MREGFAAENMNILRHLALNLLKAETGYKRSVNLKRKKCVLSPNFLLKVFSFFVSDCRVKIPAADASAVAKAIIALVIIEKKLYNIIII